MATGMNWDLASYFEEFNGARMLSFKTDLRADIDALIEKSSRLSPIDEENVSMWKTVLVEAEELGKRLSHLSSYVGCLCSDDANNEEYGREYAELDSVHAHSTKIVINLKVALKATSDEGVEKLLSLEGMEELRFMVTELRLQARKTMSGELEGLAADLSTDGINAWGRLYSTISGKLMFDMHWPDGRVEKTPISQCRSLMQDADREVRRAAFEHGNKAWETVQDVCATAINSIAGTRLLLNERRGVEHFLDEALVQSRTSRSALDAMFGAIDECRPFIQELGKAKADALGLGKLAWFDCEAPLSIPGVNRYTWEECIEIAQTSFGQAYPALREFFDEMLEKRWIESEPRPGKRPGAFCTGSYLTEESRVFMTFNGSFSDITTLAHEVGHAFHSRQLVGVRPYLREYPMTLAESASTFAELLLADGVLSKPDSSEAEKLGVLTETVNRCISFLIDIPIRFRFEKALYEERSGGIVGVSRLKALMRTTMESQFGDLLEQGKTDELFWASKMHFYLTGISFYNFPYTFGYLLSRGLYEMFRSEGPAFLERYREFLRHSGSDMAHEVAKKTLGANLEEQDFWRSAIIGHSRELEMFKGLVEKVLR